MTYKKEADALENEILDCIDARRVPDFNSLALRIFTHQLRYNDPYARYCASLGVSASSLPGSWEAIPPVPAGAFKEAALCTFDPARAALTFRTSGTTTGAGGMHYMETARLYDAALLAGFHDALLAGDSRPLRYLLLVPSPAERPTSSLGYMMRKVADAYGDGREEWFLEGDALHAERFIAATREVIQERAPACIAGTAFAFVTLLDALEERGISALPLPAGSRIMETGGFKGRTRIVERSQLYAGLAQAFALTQEQIVAEYGMTELTSQYYDRASTRSAVLRHAQHDRSDAARVKWGPPWLRARVVGPDGLTLPDGIVGALVHVDLANRSSCVAVQTEDLGVATGDGGIVLIGREHGADLRGCSLDAEQLRVLAAK